MILAALFFSTFVVVFALGAQSLLVNNGHYASAFANSFLIGGCNMVLFKLAPHAVPMEVAAYLLGGPFGIIGAMWVFRHLHRKPRKKRGGRKA